MVKKVKQPEGPSAEDLAQMKAIYELTPTYVNGLYLTPLMMGKTTMIRVTYTEWNVVQRQAIPRLAIAISLEDLQNNYNAMTTLLQQMREMGRIE